MKIAVVTNDGITVSQHFGRSRYYAVADIENGEVADIKLRERGTGHFAASHSPVEHSHHNHSQGHGYGEEAMIRHAAMAQEIADCQVLIAGGMGMGAYESFRAAGLEVILTDREMIEDALRDYLAGKLPNLMEERTH